MLFHALPVVIPLTINLINTSRMKCCLSCMKCAFTHFQLSSAHFSQKINTEKNCYEIFFYHLILQAAVWFAFIFLDSSIVYLPIPVQAFSIHRKKQKSRLLFNIEISFNCVVTLFQTILKHTVHFSQNTTSVEL